MKIPIESIQILRKGFKGKKHKDCGGTIQVTKGNKDHYYIICGSCRVNVAIDDIVDNEYSAAHIHHELKKKIKINIDNAVTIEYPKSVDKIKNKLR